MQCSDNSSWLYFSTDIDYTRVSGYRIGNLVVLEILRIAIKSLILDAPNPKA